MTTEKLQDKIKVRSHKEIYDSLNKRDKAIHCLGQNVGYKKCQKDVKQKLSDLKKELIDKHKSLNRDIQSGEYWMRAFLLMRTAINEAFDKHIGLGSED